MTPTPSAVFLGLETSTPLGSVALAGPAGLAAERALGITGSHAARLMKAVDAVLEETGLGLADLAGIGVSVGPGSFTGLRVGVATAQGLARGAERPLYAVPSLEAVAWGLSAALLPPGGVVGVAMIARRGEIYGAVYETAPAAGEGALTVLIAPVVTAPDAFADDLAALEVPVRVAGTAAGPVAARAARTGAAVTAAPALFAAPRAAVVAWRAAVMAAAGEGCGPEGLVPRYLAASQAEIKANLKAGMRARAGGAT